PTLSYDIPKIKPWVDKMTKLKNVAVRKSSGEVEGQFIKGEKGAQSTIYSDPKQLPKDVHVCPVGVKVVVNKATGLPEIDPKTGKAKLQKSCKGCKKCWDKSTKKIAYLKH
ncbi:MAG: hypothetical protein KJO69_02570, partial [Gammaproteobacteria bacterium]|nr:hypothetical protein [Gammaproteobacteria bacterium]